MVWENRALPGYGRSDRPPGQSHVLTDTAAVGVVSSPVWCSRGVCRPDRLVTTLSEH